MQEEQSTSTYAIYRDTNFAEVILSEIIHALSTQPALEKMHLLHLMSFLKLSIKEAQGIFMKLSLDVMWE